MENKNGISIAAMVLGIVAIVLCWFWFIAFPCGVLAIIFGCIGKKKNNNNFAKTGLILGIVYMGILLVIILLMFTAVGTSIYLNDGLFERARDARYEVERQEQLNKHNYYEVLDDDYLLDDYDWLYEIEEEEIDSIYNNI